MPPLARSSDTSVASALMERGVQLQSMPLYVLQRVAWNVCNMDFRLTAGIDWEGANYAALRPLLATCRALRQLALLAAFREWEICIEDGLSIENSFKACGLLVPECAYPTYSRYARCAIVTVSAAAIADGSAQHIVDSSILRSMCFMFVSRVDLRMHFENNVYAANHQMASNMSKFLQLLGILIPHASSQHVFIHQEGCVTKNEYTGPLDQLAHRIFGLSPTGGSLLPYRGRTLFVPNLTQIGCEWGDGHEHMAHVIRQSAGTLFSLDLIIRHNDDIQQLFTSDTGDSIIYPSLTWFKLHSRGPQAALTTSIHVRNAPFPNVEGMWANYFPFSDDTIFRNVRSLKYLRISVDAKTLHALNTRRVFTKERLPSLRIASMSSVVDDDDDGSSQLIDHHLQLVYNLMQFVTDVAIFDTEIATKLPAYLSERASVTGLQTLFLKDCNLGLESLLVLIQMLPSLQMLKCPVVQLGGHPGIVDSIALASRMRAKFDMRRTCLRTWSIINDDVFPTKTIALCMLIAADLCPKLGRIEFDHTCDMIDDIFDAARGSKLLASFAGRLDIALVEGSLPPTVYIRRWLELPPT